MTVTFVYVANVVVIRWAFRVPSMKTVPAKATPVSMMQPKIAIVVTTANGSLPRSVATVNAKVTKSVTMAITPAKTAVVLPVSLNAVVMASSNRT